MECLRIGMEKMKASIPLAIPACLTESLSLNHNIRTLQDYCTCSSLIGSFFMKAVNLYSHKKPTHQ